MREPIGRLNRNWTTTKQYRTESCQNGKTLNIISMPIINLGSFFCIDYIIKLIMHTFPTWINLI